VCSWPNSRFFRSINKPVRRPHSSLCVIVFPSHPRDIFQVFARRANEWQELLLKDSSCVLIILLLSVQLFGLKADCQCGKISELRPVPLPGTSTSSARFQDFTPGEALSTSGAQKPNHVISCGQTVLAGARSPFVSSKRIPCSFLIQFQTSKSSNSAAGSVIASPTKPSTISRLIKRSPRSTPAGPSNSQSHPSGNANTRSNSGSRINPFFPRPGIVLHYKPLVQPKAEDPRPDQVKGLVLHKLLEIPTCGQDERWPEERLKIVQNRKALHPGKLTAQGLPSTTACVPVSFAT
jgi:hypothetical protein